MRIAKAGFPPPAVPPAIPGFGLGQVGRLGNDLISRGLHCRARPCENGRLSRRALKAAASWLPAGLTSRPRNLCSRDIRARRFPTGRSTFAYGRLAERSGWGRSPRRGCATGRPQSCSITWERICEKSRNCSATRISARPCAIPMSAMNRHGRRRKRSVTLWSENAAAGTTHPRTIMTIIVFHAYL